MPFGFRVITEHVNVSFGLLDKSKMLLLKIEEGMPMKILYK